MNIFSNALVVLRVYETARLSAGATFGTYIECLSIVCEQNITNLKQIPYFCGLDILQTKKLTFIPQLYC